MGNKYNRQIRRIVNAKYKSAFDEVRLYIEAKARSASFGKRLRIAARYVFKKDFDIFL